MQNEDYRSNKGVSQSMIKQWQYKSPKQWKALFIDQETDLDKDESAFIFGSLVDTLAFSPELLDERFFIGEGNIPSEAVAVIIQNIYAQIQAKNAEIDRLNQEPLIEPFVRLSEALEGNETILLECAKGWNNRWSDEAVIKNIKLQGEEYFNFLREAGGRKIISSQMNMQAIDMVSILRTHEDTKDYFVSSKDGELLFQLELFDEYVTESGQKIPRKGALDILRINHQEKWLQIADLKTSYSAFEFPQSVKKYGYCDQQSYYTDLLYSWQRANPQYKGYRVIPPINIVIDLKDRIPYIYEYETLDLQIARDGNENWMYHAFENGLVYNPFKLKRGWKSILEEIGWHMKNDLWDKPREMYENKRIKLNLRN